ncbi:MAG: hypothetical protein JKY19_14550 [Alcanivoracaceae bacterium]|nr:hypothetical protein [Alcanivoracaceae bacterium]
MTTNSQEHKISQLNVIPKKLISLFSRAVAKLILRFNISRHDYNHCLNEQLVLEAKKQNPKASKVELAVRTGIDRRFITGYLNGEMPAVKSNKLTLILSDIKWTLNKYYPGQNKLPKKGPFKTFESICEQWSSGTLTYKAVLTELVRIGSVIDHGKQIELIVAKQSDALKTIQRFDTSTSVLNRYADTVLHNFKDLTFEEKNYQMSSFSTQIGPADIKELKPKMKTLLKKSSNDIIDLLEKYESDVKPDTYPSYGVSVFEFNDNEDK